MTDVAQQLVGWVTRRWHAASIRGRAGYVVLILGFCVGVAVVAPDFPLVGPLLKDLFARARPEVQVGVLVLLLAVLVVTVIVALDRKKGVEDLKGENTRLRTEADTARQAAAQLQQRWDHLLAVECRSVLWRRDPRVVPPPFVTKLNRKTRFLTVLNLKGGVGKTTLTANLGAGLAAGSPALRVLLIDLDFQSTLSRATVDQAVIGVQKQNGSFVRVLLTTPAADPGLVRRLAVPMNGVAGAEVILTDEDLDAEEFQLQARFFVEPASDPRFRFRLHLHQPAVLDAFDLVIFDCPPRVTTSVVNAVASSDYVLIPTTLDAGDIDAIPRTMAWMKSLGGNCSAEVLGVVASHATVRTGKLVKADQGSFVYLRGVVTSECGDEKKLLDAVVPSSNKAVGSDGQIGSLTADGRKVFAGVVKELQGRMGL